MQPHVFVVMPFGSKEAQAATPAEDGKPGRPAVRVDFDEVYDQLIAPALVEAKCLPFRADKEPGAGDIRVDMYFELVTADVVLADVSVLNPNVFYELGLRHGVAPRGIFLTHGGWSRPPFDIVSDRRFAYDGTLFTTKPADRDAGWQPRVEAEAKRLGGVLRSALDADEMTIGSPVYSDLQGLEPVNWKNVQTQRAKYFGAVFADWKARVKTARSYGWAGDILTLAEDSPTRFHHCQLLWEAASALMSIQRFAVARKVLEQLVAIEPDHVKAQTQLGLALGRLGLMNEASVHMTNVEQRHAGDPEAQGILARVYKDLWKIEWSHLGTLGERQQTAVTTSSFIASAIRSYDVATRKHVDYYNGINVVSFLSILSHLQTATGRKPTHVGIDDLPSLIEVVRFAARNALDAAMRDRRTEDAVWAKATLGELELVAGSAEAGLALYTDAAVGPDTTYFQVSSMLEQMVLFESLGFRPDAVGPVKAMLELRGRQLAQRLSAPDTAAPRPRKVVVFSGHVIDKPGRADERFPARKEPLVRDRIRSQLAKWEIGTGDLAICGGARGGDILFAEACVERGAAVRIFLALAEPEFLEASVRLPDSDWEDRFYALRDHAAVKTAIQPDRLKAPPKGVSPFARNNAWMVNTARVEADDPKNLYAMLVWDEHRTADGPGGTVDFAERVRQVAGRVAPTINPTKL